MKKFVFLLLTVFVTPVYRFVTDYTTYAPMKGWLTVPAKSTFVSRPIFNI